MNPTGPTGLENQVIESLQLMQSNYQRIDDLTLQMLDKQARGTSIQDDMDTLKAELEGLNQIQQRTQSARDAYRSSQPTASVAVNALIEQTGNMIQNVLLKIAKLEDSAKQSQRRLIPEIDQAVRGNQMKQAYGGSTR
jgi:hypothetical protein